jgi:hypothetical protein
MATFFTDTGSFQRIEGSGSAIISSSIGNTLSVIGSGRNILSISGSRGSILQIGEAQSNNSEVFVISSASIDVFRIFNNKTLSVSGSLTVTGSLFLNGVAVGTGGGSGTPGGSNTNVQFNDAGAFSGSTAFTFNKTAETVGIGADASINSLTKLLVRNGNVVVGNGNGISFEEFAGSAPSSIYSSDTGYGASFGRDIVISNAKNGAIINATGLTTQPGWVNTGFVWSTFGNIGMVLDTSGSLKLGDGISPTDPFSRPNAKLNVQGSGSALLIVTGSRGRLLTVSDSLSDRKTLATISSGSSNVFTFTTSSLIVTGSVIANIETDAMLYGRIVVTPTGTQNNYSPTGWNDADPNKAVTINITGTNSLKITGLAGGVAGRLAVLKNSSTDKLIILEDESASSTAANRFDFRNPIFLLPNGSVTLLYDGVDSRWQPIASSGGIGFGAFFDNYDDFIGGANTFGTTAAEVGRYVGIASGGGAGGAVSNYLINSTEKPLGVYRITPGTTTTGRALLGAGPTTGGGTFTEAVLNNVVPANGQAVFLCRIAVETLSTSGDEFQIFAGFQDAVSTNVTDGVYWQYIRTASTAWQGATANNGTRTATGAAGPTVDTNYIWLGIYINPTWARATYFYSTDSVTWVMAGEITTNLPTSARNTGVGILMNKSAGTNVRNCSIDLMAVRYDISRG